MRKYLWAAVLSAAALCHGQNALSEAEQKDLQQALREAGSSPLEFARVLEKHLEKYPESPQRDELQRSIVKAAIEADDKRRILLWGERVLEKNPDNPQILERVARLLLTGAEKPAAERALKYAKKFEEILRALEEEGPSSGREKAQLMEELERALARALVLQSRATGNLGQVDDAIVLATKSYDSYPNAESAREIGRWLAAAGRNMEAVERYADAFTVPDSRNTDADRAKDRAKLSELYAKEHDGERGLGDIVLRAYDRTAALVHKRAALRKQQDPNAGVTDPMSFTLAGLEGPSLDLASLRGKVIVMDFWATWCGPCRVQHPLYEEVRKRFAERDDLVFLAINTDEDRTVVKPFLDQNGWSKTVYFEDGLSNLLRVSSIPTTIVVDKEGRLFSRMNGFNPETFVEQLTNRIKDALAGSGENAASLERPEN
jgi:thiol-disulfide isomerase/thioredoxin